MGRKNKIMEWEKKWKELDSQGFIKPPELLGAFRRTKESAFGEDAPVLGCEAWNAEKTGRCGNERCSGCPEEAPRKRRRSQKDGRCPEEALGCDQGTAMMPSDSAVEYINRIDTRETFDNALETLVTDSCRAYDHWNLLLHINESSKEYIREIYQTVFFWNTVQRSLQDGVILRPVSPTA
jgi:hypothetical protein